MCTRKQKLKRFKNWQSRTKESIKMFIPLNVDPLGEVDDDWRLIDVGPPVAPGAKFG